MQKSHQLGHANLVTIHSSVVLAQPRAAIIDKHNMDTSCCGEMKRFSANSSTKLWHIKLTDYRPPVGLIRGVCQLATCAIVTMVLEACWFNITSLFGYLW